MHVPWMKGRLAAGLLLLAPLGAGAQGGEVAGKVQATPLRFLGETVVYLKRAPGSRPPVTHAMDQKGMKFLPLVLAIAAGDTVEFLNHDSADHNVHSVDGEGFDLGTFAMEQKRSRRFDTPGVYRIGCTIHPDMIAWVFVGQNPHAVPVDRIGRYRLTNVPPGTYQLAVWNAHLKGAERTVTVTAGQAVEESFTLKE